VDGTLVMMAKQMNFASEQRKDTSNLNIFMSKLKSAARKLNPYAVKTAMQMERIRHELAMTMVAERVKEDAEFAAAVLKVAGEHLREEIKKDAEATIAKAKIVSEGSALVEERRNEPSVALDNVLNADNGSTLPIIDIKEDVLNKMADEEVKSLVTNFPLTIDKSKAQALVEKWEKTTLLDSGSLNNETAILLESEPYVPIENQDIPLGNGEVAVQSDGGGMVIVPETHLPDYPIDGIFMDEQITKAIGLYEKSGLANAGECCGGGCGCHVDPNVPMEELQKVLDKASENQTKKLKESGLI
jgi:hypothetical protein